VRDISQDQSFQLSGILGAKLGNIQRLMTCPSVGA
jgi:hypothetical protein